MVGQDGKLYFGSGYGPRGHDKQNSDVASMVDEFATQHPPTGTMNSPKHSGGRRNKN